VAETLGVDSDHPDLGPAAGFDERGNLKLDREVVEQVRASFLRRCAPEYIDEMEQTQRERCRALVEATDGAAAVAGNEPDLEEARLALAGVAAGIDRFIPYPILTKFVPELLLQALREAGDEGPPPFLNPSPGGELSRAMLDLYGACLAMGFPPERLAAAWPDVEPRVDGAVRSFCRQHTGFGPVTWEAPGFETPEFLFAAMRAAFGDADPEDLRRRLAGRVPVGEDGDPEGLGPDTSWPGRLRRCLRSWLELLELEIWYLRGAFYRGILPLLQSDRAWLQDGGSLREALLFAEIGELLTGRLDPAILEARRNGYLGDHEYLAQNAVGPERLSTIMEGI
jgi:hypothetical protein